MIRKIAPVALIALTACSGGLTMTDFRPAATPVPAAAIRPPTPQPVMRTAKERLVGAIENNGCSLTADNVGAILTEATISRDELTQLAPQLQAEGRAEVSGSGAIRVLTDRCI